MRIVYFEMSEDFELDKTIGDVFKQFQDELELEADKKDNNDEYPQQERLKDDNSKENDVKIAEHDNLDQTISNVFNSFQGDILSKQGEEDVNEDKNQSKHHKQDQYSKNHENDDDLLADAITNALQSINEIRPDPIVDETQVSPQVEPVTESFNEKPPYSPMIMEKDEDLDLKNAIGDAFASIQHEPHPKSPPKSNEDDSNDKQESRDTINDDLLTELAKQITQQVQQTTEETLNPTKTKQLQLSETDKDDDNLNQLQMNDILTNAFNMAMENPTELLNNLESEEFNLTSNLTTKRLSIAETLALHRSRDNQLQSILADLAHENMGGNLMTMIKQITSFISNSNFQVFKNTTSLVLIINDYKNTQLESIFLSCLSLAKMYLASQHKTKAITAIDNVLLLLGKSGEEDSRHDFNVIDGLVQIIKDIIRNFRNLKTFRTGKPKINSLEYKEKVRLENRERKKKWREDNSERNKDNDLRSRVLKRANMMFGSESSIEKSNWMEEEFQKRKEKRIARQQKDEEGQFKGEFTNVNISNNSTFINDKVLIKFGDDLFNIFLNFAPRDDNITGLDTTSAVIASLGMVYLGKFNIDMKRIESIMTSIMTNLINSMNTLDQQERLTYLAKGSNVYESSTLTYPSNDETIQSTKEYEVHKRVKINQVKDLTLNLKFPRYKSGDKKVVQFKKPATFQRPSYTQPQKKNYGFPQFYSTISK